MSLMTSSRLSPLRTHHLLSAISPRTTIPWSTPTSTIIARSRHSLTSTHNPTHRSPRSSQSRYDTSQYRRISAINNVVHLSHAQTTTTSQPLINSSQRPIPFLSKLAFTIPILPSLPDFPSLTTLCEILLSYPFPTPSGPSYALTIILLTLLVRTTTTLPTTLWARARGRRLREVVRPEMKKINERLAVIVMKECRRAGLGYEGYKIELKKRLAEEQSLLMKQHKCHPLPTILLPPLVHLPIFLLLSLTIRQAVKTPLEISQQLLTTTLDTTTSLDTTTTVFETSSIFPFANESFLWLSNLVDTDPYMALPFAIGLMAFSNVEVMQRWRGDLRSAVKEEIAIQSQQTPTTSPTTTTTSSHRRFSTSSSSSYAVVSGTRIPGSRSKSKHQHQPKTTILQSEMDSGNISPSEREKRLAAQDKGGLRERVIGNVLRIVAVCSVGIAAEAPAAVALYWATSTGFTLVQNLVLGLLDRRREKRKAVTI